MIDMEKQVAYWRDGAEEDWAVARELVGLGRSRHGLFFAHLAMEKILKAHVCAATRKLAPRIHNLLILVEITGLRLSQDRRKTLATLNAFCLAGRYPETLPPTPSAAQASAILKRSGEAFTWLADKL
ncbi:MAG: HEPN domain-containing protein [Planctomycetota bacterium]|nr:HEPN domain-containing protein [Planctomycetota bacterium]